MIGTWIFMVKVRKIWYYFEHLKPRHSSRTLINIHLHVAPTHNHNLFHSGSPINICIYSKCFPSKNRVNLVCVKASILRILTSIRTTREFLASSSGIGDFSFLAFGATSQSNWYQTFGDITVVSQLPTPIAQCRKATSRKKEDLLLLTSIYFLNSKPEIPLIKH